MKKRCIAVVLLWVIITCFGLHIRSIAYADPFTASQLASAAYGFMSGAGITFGAGTATAGGMNNFMTQQIESYVNHSGGSLADVFVGQLAVDAAGKLAMTFDMYNSMVGFVGWLKDKYSLSAEDFALTNGEYEGTFIPTDEIQGGTEITGVGIEAQFTEPYELPTGMMGYATIGVYNNGALITSYRLNYIFKFGADYSIFYNNMMVGVYAKVYYSNSGAYSQTLAYNAGTVALDNSLSWSVPEGWTMPTVLNPDKAWTGTIGGYSEPDTNLDQLLGDINQAVADNNLVVDGEVIDIPVPPGPVPTWTPVDDVIDGINQQGEILEGIGNDIGDISGHLDDIGDQVDGLEQSLEGVQEGIETQTGVISGAIDQATSDVVDAIGEQTATLDQTLTETAEGVQDIADALQPGQITPRQFDLRRLFPFCIPFDIHNLLSKFDAEPVAPHVQLPFVIQSIGFSYTFDLDFSAFNSVAAVMRTVEFIVFAIGLAWATSKVIKW